MRGAKSFQDRRSGSTFVRLPIKMRPVFARRGQGEPMIFRATTTVPSASLICNEAKTQSILIDFHFV